jgi:hypothetical protein
MPILAATAEEDSWQRLSAKRLQATGRPADLVAISGRTHPVSNGKGFGMRPMN